MTDETKRGDDALDTSADPVIPYHPDQQALNDWGMFGPKNPRIEQLVRELALDHDLRLAEIEELIVLALRRQLDAQRR